MATQRTTQAQGNQLKQTGSTIRQGPQAKAPSAGRTAADKTYKKKRSRRDNHKKKVAKKQAVEDPDKIIESILQNSSFKVANLSQVVCEKFYNSNHYQAHYKKLTADIDYSKSTTTFSPLSDFVVLPDGVEESQVVSVPAHAFMHMPCIYEKPARDRRKRGKSKTGEKKQSEQTKKTRDNSINDSQKKEPNLASAIDIKKYLDTSSREEDESPSQSECDTQNDSSEDERTSQETSTDDTGTVME